jgi:hypothetical protein
MALSSCGRVDYFSCSRGGQAVKEFKEDFLTAPEVKLAPRRTGYSADIGGVVRFIALDDASRRFPSSSRLPSYASERCQGIPKHVRSTSNRAFATCAGVRSKTRRYINTRRSSTRIHL